MFAPRDSLNASGDDGADVKLILRTEDEVARGASEAVAVYDRTWWRVVHAVSFLTGGVTFCAGTGALWNPSEAAALASAVL
jgi:hypothetical protein